MSTTKYCDIMNHFNNLILGTYPRGTGYETIRTVYERAFDMNVNLQDIYETRLSIPTNPIKGIITLLGPDPKDEREIPTGLIGFDESSVFYVTHYTDDIFKDLSDIEEARFYIKSVFNTIYDIVKFDKFDIKYARNNPYVTTLYSYPFYFTYHHVKRCFPHLINDEVFFEIFEKYYSDSEYTKQVLESLNANEYSSIPESIYSAMTCKNTIQIV